MVLSGKLVWRQRQIADIYLWEIGGGVNSWVRIAPYSRVCPKVGFGDLFCNSILSVSGDAGTSRFSGAGVIWQALSGVDVVFSRFIINVDICVPFCNIPFSSTENNLNVNSSYRLPDKLEYFGIEIRPGFTYHF